MNEWCQVTPATTAGLVDADDSANDTPYVELVQNLCLASHRFLEKKGKKWSFIFV